MTEQAPIRFVPYHQDPLEAAASLIIRRFSGRLPDLTGAIVLLPVGAGGRQLRRHLLAQAESLGYGALLGPDTEPVRGWVQRTGPIDAPIPSAYAGELMLVEAMLEHPGLFGGGNPWAVAASLITLFDELTLHQVVLPDSLDAFAKRLCSAYGLSQPAGRPLTREAELVYTLWQAWHAQIHAEGMTDRQQAYLHQLSTVADRLPADSHCFFVGHHRLLPGEAALAGRLMTRDRATLILHGSPDSHPLAARLRALMGAPAPPTDDEPAGPYSEFLDRVYLHAARPGAEPNADPRDATPPDTAGRAAAFATRHPESPVHPRLSVFEAHGPEHEAQAVDLQVRRWILEGRRRVAIVTDDRRLARRVRALLERAGVTLRDTAGWALSTASAAAALERWLEALEEDFHHQPLLDLLRSPFILPRWERARLQNTVYRLEQDVILHENIARGLTRYRNALASRRRRLGAAVAPGLDGLLDTLEEAAFPLKPLLKNERQSPLRLLDALAVSLDTLGLAQGFSVDAAGLQVLQVLEQLRRSVSGRRITMTWTEFRAWLGRALESAHFSPAPAPSGVELLPLANGTPGRFDGLVMAGLDHTRLPGDEHAAPFFNNAVRRELGLPGPPDTRREKLHQLRALLEAAPRILLTVCVEKDGERVTPSPWLELLQSFHHLAYGERIGDPALQRLVRLHETQVVHSDAGALPARHPYPAPAVDPRLIPHTMTATAHQQLMDCPYQFFAARCLDLAAPEPVTEKLSKSDYGERIHRILQAFHAPVPGLPGPFDQPITEANREQAVAMLQRVSAAVFSTDLEDNFLHRGWLRRWEALIDSYVDWQMKRGAQWRVRDVEVNAVREHFGELLRIKGRLDRIDTGPEGTAVIDYKTGEVPGKQDIVSGEAVQLPFYALLMETPVARIEYLSLDRNRFGTCGYLEGEDLSALRDATALRLDTMMRRIRRGTALPAWADEQTCSRCRMEGLCRKQAWQPSPP